MDAWTRRWFDSSTIKVVRSRELAGWFTDDEWARLAGAPSGSVLHVAQQQHGAVELRVENSALLTEPLVRLIVQEADGYAFHIVNAAFSLRPHEMRRGLGARSVSMEIHEAKRMGCFTHVRTHAVGDYASARAASPLVGYAVWPRLGFDADLTAALRLHPALPQGCRKATRVLDLFESDEGRRFWAVHGSSLWLEFDLAEGSPSWSVLQRYCARRGIRVIK